MVIAFDVAAAENFTLAVTGSVDTVLCFQLADDTGRHRKELARKYTGTVRGMAQALEQWNNAGCAVWVQINAGHRGVRNVTGIRAYFIDDDGKGSFPPVPRLPPSIIVQSSGGERNRHYYWLAKPNEPLERFTPTQKQLIATYDTDKSIHNLDRVMRLPGTWNWGGGKPGRSHLPEPVRLLHVDASRQAYSADEIRAAHPLAPAVAESLAAEAQPEIHTEQSLASAGRLAQWLMDQSVEHVRVSPISFKIRCCWNRDHGVTTMVRVQPRGGYWAGCFHDSCDANRNRWSEIKDKIGGWHGAESFARGDDVELGHRLLADLGSGSDADVVYDRGKLWIYRSTGLWEGFTDDTLRKLAMGYAGAKVGEKGRLKLSAHGLDGAIRCARSLSEQQGFFDNVAPGANFSNGFLAITPTGTALIPHAAEHRQTVGLPFPYGTHAAAPRWLRFLDECFEGDADATAKITLLQEFLGACLVGSASRFQKALMLVGEGENGKSVFTNVAFSLFPPNARSAVKPQDFGSEYMRATLLNARINVVSETPDAEILSSDSFKAIVTGDTIMARAPYGAPFVFNPTAGHLFAANRLPGTGDHSKGFWRRFMVVEWNRTFPPEKREAGLSDWLIANELPGIAAWAGAGAAALLAKQIYNVPDSSVVALEGWKKESNPVALFVADCCTIDNTLMYGCRANEAFTAYRTWAAANGHKPMSNTSFGRRLRGLGIMSTRRTDGVFYPMKIYIPEGMRGLYLV